MSAHRCCRLLLLILLSAVASHGSQIILTMKSGERLIGEVSEESNESKIIFHSPLLGKLELPKDAILEQKPLLREIDAERNIPASSQSGAMASKESSREQKRQEFEEAFAQTQDSSLVDKLVNLQTPDSWRGNLRFGMDLNYGDSEWKQLYARGNLVVDPEQSPNYYRLTGAYTYRTTQRRDEVVKSADRYDGDFIFRRDMTDFMFLQNYLGARMDAIKGIDHEIQEMVGLGLRLNPYEQIELIIGGGGGVEHFDADFQSDRLGDNPVANGFQELTWQPFEKLTFAQEFSYFYNPVNGAQYNYIFSASFRYRLTELLGFEISYDQNFDYDVGDGNVRDDSQWRNAIIVYF